MFGRGNSRLPMSTAAFEKRLAGIWSFGNGAPVSGSIGFVLLCEKSPARSAAVGSTCPVFVVALRSRRDSHEKKRNVLSLIIGPPTLAPNWFRFRVGLFTRPAWPKNDLASNLSFLKYS